MTPSEQEIRASIERICKHRTFVKSGVHIRLLRYLLEKREEGEDLKEITIGADLFGKNYGIDRKEGAVRSYMYQLRKRLDTYYADPDTNESFRFSIEKGQYNLSIEVLGEGEKEKVQKEVGGQENRSPSRKKLLLKLMLTVGLVLILLIFGVLFAQRSFDQLPFFWEPFLEADASVKIVISDQFMVQETNEHGEPHAIIYGEINSVDDFVDYTQQHPERLLKTTDYTLMSKMTPFAIKRFSEWFIERNRDFSILLESQMSYADVKENHLIFVGQYKTMNFSESLFLRNSKAFSVFGDGFKFTSEDGVETEYDTVFRNSEYVEYAMVSFSSFAPGKSALYLVSNNDIGVMAMVRNFTDNAWVVDFMNKLPAEGETYFNALFEVVGIQRNDVSCRLVEIEIVE